MVDWKKENLVYLIALSSIVLALVFILSWGSGALTGRAIDSGDIGNFDFGDVPRTPEEGQELASSKFGDFLNGDNIFGNSNRFLLSHQGTFLFLFNQPYSFSGVFFWTVFLWIIIFSMSSNILRGFGLYKYGLNLALGLLITWIFAKITFTPMIADALMSTLLHPEHGNWRYINGAVIFFVLLFADIFVNIFTTRILKTREARRQAQGVKVAEASAGKIESYEETIQKIREQVEESRALADRHREMAERTRETAEAAMEKIRELEAQQAKPGVPEELEYAREIAKKSQEAVEGAIERVEKAEQRAQEAEETAKAAMEQAKELDERVQEAEETAEEAMEKKEGKISFWKIFKTFRKYKKEKRIKRYEKKLEELIRQQKELLNAQLK